MALQQERARTQRNRSRPQSDWITPSFVQITQKRTKCKSPYLDSELWEHDELLIVIKYKLYKRNKAALSLLWDLDARNHEVTADSR
jgi:integrase/recombinase XerD